MRVLVPPKTGRACFPGVKVFDRPIPEREGNDSLRFPRELTASAIRGIHSQIDCSTLPIQSNRTRTEVFRIAADYALVNAGGGRPLWPKVLAASPSPEI